MGDDGANVAREKILVSPDAEEEWTSAARPDNLAGVICMDDRDAISAHYILEGKANGFGECGPVGAGIVGVDFLVMLADQMGKDFGIGLRGELVAPSEKPFLEKLVVLDHPVVNKRNFSGLV